MAGNLVRAENVKEQKQAGAELSQAQGKLKVIGEVGVEVGGEGDFQTCPVGGCLK